MALKITKNERYKYLHSSIKYYVSLVLAVNDTTQAIIMIRTKISYIKMVARTWDLVTETYS